MLESINTLFIQFNNLMCTIYNFRAHIYSLSTHRGSLRQQKNNQMQDDQHSNVSLTDSDQFSQSDDDMFGNLAPINVKTSFDIPSNQNAKLMLAKMKRLIGSSSNAKSLLANSANTQSQKAKQNTKPKIQKTFLSEESKFQSEDQSRQSQERERSRDRKVAPKTAQSIKSSQGMKKGKKQDAANLSIQKQVVKQNDSLSSNKISDKKDGFGSGQKPIDSKMAERMEKFAEMEKMLFVPVEQLPILKKTDEEVREEKREKKRLDRMLEKKYKQYKVGKVKDQASNCVFNGIEDYFN